MFTGLPPGLIVTESKVNEASALTILLPAKSTGNILFVTKALVPSFSNQATDGSE